MTFKNWSQELPANIAGTRVRLLYLNLKGHLNRTSGLDFMAQTPRVSFCQEQRRFWRIYVINPPKLPFFWVKTNTQSFGYKNQTICPIKTPFEILIHFYEPISMKPKKFEIILADFLLFLINFQTKKSTHLRNAISQKHQFLEFSGIQKLKCINMLVKMVFAIFGYYFKYLFFH